jgi:3D (Asp-Asp-Asp) domain-containing protein
MQRASGRRRGGLGGSLLMVLAACSSSSGDATRANEDGGPAVDGTAPATSDALAPAPDANASDSSGLDIDAGGAAGDAGLETSDGAGGADAAGDVGAEAGTTMSVYVTFYGWADNSPPGGAIAYPKTGGFATFHDAAGGTGTLADPITYATDKAEFPVGTILYVPFIEKYVVMEDDCVECDSDWSGSRKRHIDIWMNSNAAEDENSLLQCEDAWTRSATNVEVNPPADRPVTTAPLFVPSTNTCRTSP